MLFLFYLMNYFYELNLEFVGYESNIFISNKKIKESIRKQFLTFKNLS